MKKSETNPLVKSDSACDALVMFCDSVSVPYLKMLKTGFKHCFVAVRSDKDWIVYEPLLGRTEISVIKNADIEYVTQCFEMMGCIVCPTTLQRSVAVKQNLLAPFTCVNAVSRVLGIQSSFLSTPWKLYKRISQ